MLQMCKVAFQVRCLSLAWYFEHLDEKWFVVLMAGSRSAGTRYQNGKVVQRLFNIVSFAPLIESLACRELHSCCSQGRWCLQTSGFTPDKLLHSHLSSKYSVLQESLCESSCGKCCRAALLSSVHAAQTSNPFQVRDVTFTLGIFD